MKTFKQHLNDGYLTLDSFKQKVKKIVKYDKIVDAIVDVIGLNNIDPKATNIKDKVLSWYNNNKEEKTKYLDDFKNEHPVAAVINKISIWGLAIIVVSIICAKHAVEMDTLAKKVQSTDYETILKRVRGTENLYK